MRGRLLFELDRATATPDSAGGARNIDPGLCRRLGSDPGLASLRRSLCE